MPDYLHMAFLAKQAASGHEKIAKERVRVLLPYGKKQYLMEHLWQPRWPETIGHRRYPGGGVDEGEDRLAALVRELREELGANANPADIKYVGRDPRPETANEIYYQWDNHGLAPGDYEDAANPGIPIKLRAGSPWGKMYKGPSLKQLIKEAGAADYLKLAFWLNKSPTRIE